MIQSFDSRSILETEQFFDRPPDAIFPFFADAENLGRITPRWINFQIITPTPIDMGVGTLIDYRIRLYGVPMRWRTKITAWEPPFRFIDEQLKGPYEFWIHEHTFTAHDGGTRMHDRVTFRARAPRFIRPVVHRIFVNRNVQRIFEFRRQSLRELLPLREDSDTRRTDQTSAH